MLLLILATAHAADTFDAHGFRLGAFTDEPTAPLSLTLPGTYKPNAVYFGGLLEYADDLLVRVNGDGSVDGVLDSLVGLNMAAGWAPTSRIRLNASAPLFLASTGLPDDTPNGVDMGDLRIGGDVVLVDGTVSLGFVPFLDLPTGATEEFLGQAGVAGGGLLGAKFQQGRAQIGLNVGPYFQPAIGLGNLAGANRLLAGAQLGVGVSDTLGINLETRAEIPFVANDIAGADLPAEVMLYGRNRFDGGGHIVLGGATAVSTGASAATFRVFLGGGFGTFGAGPAVDTDGDGIVDASDTCPTEPETVNAYRDADGCPDQLGQLAIEVLLEGKRVVNAGVSLVGPRPLEVMSAVEPIAYPNLMPGDQYTATADFGPCAKGEGEAVVVEGETPLIIELVPQRQAVVRLEITDADGEPLHQGVATWERETTGCVPGEPVVLRDTHVGRQSIGVGSHTVFVTVEGYNTYVETVQLKEGDEKLIKVSLAPTRVVITQEKIEILEKVFFASDGDALDPKSGALLDEIAATLRSHPEILSVEVGGHTDSVGKDKYNLDLSQRRVDSVRTWLIEKGVAAERLKAQGYGEAKPVSDNKSKRGRASNRRVEFLILERTAAPAPGEIKKVPDESAGD
jgi:outer membrane protein OmpA-like peptidoglycan-associated protein